MLKEELKDRYQPEKTIIGNSPAMREVYKTIGKVAPSDITVLIQGESGTGKELIARAIHFNSKRIGKPFIALNCAAIPKELLESELFGFEKGAFTGAVERKLGKFEQANGGTIFLDEIGDMPLDLQAKILRALQEKEIIRTGGSQSIPVDVRIVAATNQDLEEKVCKKEFREDLYYRLNVVPIHARPPAGAERGRARSWSIISWTRAAPNWKSRRNMLPRRASPSLPPTAGPATSGNWKIRSSGPSSSPRTRS